MEEDYYKELKVVLVIAFLVLSIILFLPNYDNTATSVRSSELSKIVTMDGDTERTEYVDEQGKISFAADVGYAIMTVTDTENGKYEEHFDEAGNPITFKSNPFYAVLREYDEQGNNYKTAYFGANREPVLSNYGYASAIRIFNDNGKVLTEKYYGLNGEPVCTTVFGYGRLNEYDEEGNITQQAFIDENGNPMVSGQGYAIIRYNYYDTDDNNNGKVESEFYYDDDGNPNQLAIGQYGVHKEYNEDGQNSVQTFLGIDGKPIVTSKGYTTIVRTFFANNAVASEKYYDAEGNPVSLSEGQYGVSYEGGKVSYLDAEGNKQLNIKRLLFNQQYLVILSAIVVIMISTIIGRNKNILLLLMYCGFILYMALMFRGNSESQIKLEPLWAYRQVFSDAAARSDVLNNIWLFIPLGAILYRILPKRIIILVVAVLMSMGLELTQYLTGKGLCELDDVVSNGIGCMIGYELEKGLVQILLALLQQ